MMGIYICPDVKQRINGINHAKWKDEVSGIRHIGIYTCLTITQNYNGIILYH